MAKKKKLTIILVSIALILLSFIIYVLWANKAVTVNKITVESSHIPKSYDGFRIAHVSDLHNDEFGKDNKKLLSLIESSNPHIIAITGDLIDSHTPDVKLSVDFSEKAQQIAPCFYVNGNHEQRVPEEYEVLKKSLEEIGVVILENKAVPFEFKGETINIIGVSDPGFETDYLFGDTKAVMRKNLEPLICEESFNLLLSHRPELFEVYADLKVDLALTGHAHGGQFRLPFVGGLYAPNQWFFPEYDSGLYTEGDTNMIVSRGVGNSLFPLRLFNRPEVVLVELKCIN